MASQAEVHGCYRRGSRRDLLRNAAAWGGAGGIGLTAWLAKADYVVVPVLVLGVA